MPTLGWSPHALGVTSVSQRQHMTDLFQAYFRAGFPHGRTGPDGSILPLDLPAESESRYYFVAQYTQRKGWWVEAKLRRPDLAIQFADKRPHTARGY